MIDVLGLESRVVSAASAAGAGDKSATLQPSDGEMWIVAEANGYNDEGALQSRWTYSDGVTTTQLDPDITVAGTGSRISCYAKSPESANAYSSAKLPFTLDSKSSLVWTTFGLGAGKKGYIDALVYVVRGVPEQ